nr:NAD(P)H-hydrate epimerase [Demequina sp. TTPB684]
MTVAQIKDAEAATMRHTPESELMDRASQAVAEQSLALLAAHGVSVDDARIVVLVGSGNNGGDALLAGALLAADVGTVTAVGVGPSAHERGLATLTGAGGHWHHARVDAGLASAHTALASAHLVIDGIVGIGSKPNLREPAAGLVAAIAPETPVIAVDIPSGFDADSGALPDSYVTAEATVTFTALKPCLVLSPANAAAGKVIVADVGIDP